MKTKNVGQLNFTGKKYGRAFLDGHATAKSKYGCQRWLNGGCHQRLLNSMEVAQDQANSGIIYRQLWKTFTVITEKLFPKLPLSLHVLEHI